MIKKIYNNPTFRNGLRNVLNSNQLFRTIYRLLLSIKNNGVRITVQKLRKWLEFKMKKHRSKYLFQRLSSVEREAQKETEFSEDITFSIVVPLYNTPKRFLVEMIESVQAQTYEKWELCLADGSTEEFQSVENICRKYIEKDTRIKYKRLSENLGISGNTNACLEMATGEYLALFDHDDLLHESVLYYYMKEICDKGADFLYCDELTFVKRRKKITVIHYKPDFAIDNLRANNYICHFTVFSRELYEMVGGFRSEFDGSQDHDMILRLTEKAKCIVHIPKILYFWRGHANSVAANIGSKTYAIDAGKRAVGEHLERCGYKATVESVEAHPAMYKINYEIIDNPLVSILIPNKDGVELLRQCVESILAKSTYGNYEIVIVENNSTEEETFQYYEELSKCDKVKIVTFQTDGTFNYSKINNYGAKYCAGEHLILLNNDIEVISPEWIQEMLMYSQRKEVGAVGAKLYYPNDTIQHGGIILGALTLAGHSHRHFEREHPGYMGRLAYAQNMTACTAACLMLKKSVYEEIEGLDETFAVAFNDIDLCMRIRAREYLICWTPFAELYHHESVTRGEEDTPEKRARFVGEVERFQKRWKKELEAGDPYYNTNLTLDREDFGFK